MFHVLAGKIDGVMKAFLLPENDKETAQEISIKETAKKRIIFLCPEECEYSKILKVPIVVRRKQKQVIEAEIKSEMPNGENCGYAYKILSQDDEYLILLLTLFRKREVNEYVECLEKFGGQVEMVVPGAYFLVNQGRKIQARWGQTLYLSHIDHINPWFKRSDMTDTSFTSDTVEYCAHFEDNFEVGRYEDMLEIIVEYLNCDNSLKFNLLSREKRILNEFNHNKPKLIFAVVTILVVCILGSYHLHVKKGNYLEASQLIDERYEFVSRMNQRLEEEINEMKKHNAFIDRYNVGFDDAMKVEIIFKFIDEITPSFIFISLMKVDDVRKELVLEGHTDSWKLGEIEKYLERLRQFKLFSSVADMEVRENKKMGQWDFAFKLGLEKEINV